MTDPRLTNVIATVFLGLVAVTALVLALIAGVRGEASDAIPFLAASGAAVALLAPSPVQRPGA